MREGASTLSGCIPGPTPVLRIYDVLTNKQIRSHIVANVAIKRRDTADAAFEDQVSNALLPVRNLLAHAVISSSEDTLDVRPLFADAYIL